ncbi:MAG TPA: L,D-transpeptidase family protein, partial [Geobacterales bacterium]|nr:L,D-transpeptidase family protein [Geobacterales bacterium]
GSATPSTVTEKALPLPKGVRADRMLVEKGERRLTLFCQGVPLKSYRIALGHVPVGPKTMRGDGKTPEGIYQINGRNPHSRYYRALRISYPNDEDRRRAAQQGVNPGGDIMIHGLVQDVAWIGEKHALFDWTQGCIAVTNEEIREIWRVVADGTIVEIRP